MLKTCTYIFTLPDTKLLRKFFEPSSHAPSYLFCALVFFTTESANPTDGGDGSIPPADDDWRFNRGDPNEWGRRRRQKDRAILEDECAEEEKAYCRVRASWSANPLATGRVGGVGGGTCQGRIGRDPRPLKPGAIVAEGRHGGDACLRREPHHQRISAVSCAGATPGRSGDLRIKGRHQHRHPSSRRRRNRSETAAMSPERMGRAGRGGGCGGEGGGGGGESGGGSEEDFGGWGSAPEGRSGGVGGRRKPHSVRGGAGGNVGTTGADWRSMGALGRRPASREAARQLRVSERLHRLAQAMAKKKERARRRRDDLQLARVRRETQIWIRSKSRRLRPKESRSCLKCKSCTEFGIRRCLLSLSR